MKNNTRLTDKDIRIIESRIGYAFRDKRYVLQAFTHSTIANDNNLESNERLEFFGDTILDFIVSEYLVLHTNMLEGDLSVIRSSLVSAKSLSDIITDLDLSQFIMANKSLIGTNIISHNVKCDLYESILCAIYLDGGMDMAKQFVFNTLKLNEIDYENFVPCVQDYKTPLQELLQADGKHTIEYKMISQNGPAHSPRFEMSLHLDGVERARAVAYSKKEAEQLCAKEVYFNLISQKNKS